MQAEDILVIGAGPAGLASSACLRQQGLPHLLLEQGHTIGPAWHGHYDRLHLHTTQTGSALPLTPWPARTPRYPSRQQLLQYLEAYALEHRIAPRFGVTVQAVQPGANGFRVETSAGLLRPRHVIMATGSNRLPNLPAVPGLEAFHGSAIHASAYRNPGPYQGLRTLVVGCGNSGAEIALDLAVRGVEVAMVVRGPVHVVPRDLFGRPTQHTNLLLAHLPLALRDAIAVAILDLAVGDLSRWGIVRPGMGPNRMIEACGRIPLLDLGTIALVKRGRIRVLPALQEISAHAVRCAGTAWQPMDAIIFATGYRPGLEQLLPGFEAIADGRGRPRHFGPETDIAGLHFVGYRNPATGALREIALEAPRVARALRAAAL